MGYRTNPYLGNIPDIISRGGDKRLKLMEEQSAIEANRIKDENNWINSIPGAIKGGIDTYQGVQKNNRENQKLEEELRKNQAMEVLEQDKQAWMQQYQTSQLGQGDRKLALEEQNSKTPEERAAETQHTQATTSNLGANTYKTYKETGKIQPEIDNKNAETEYTKNQSRKLQDEHGDRLISGGDVLAAKAAAKELKISDEELNDALSKSKTKKDLDNFFDIQKNKAKEKSGGFTPFQQYTITKDETNRFEKQSSEAREAINTFDKMNSVVKTGKPFDKYAMIYMFNKMLDPGSVVRESEFANTQNGMGYLGKAEAYLEQLKGDGVITQKMSEEMLSTAKRLADVAKESLITKTKRARERASQLGIDPELVAPQSSQTPGSQAPQTLPGAALSPTQEINPKTGNKILRRTPLPSGTP